MFAFVILSKNPTNILVDLVKKIRKKSSDKIIIINDGSENGLEFFDQVLENKNVLVLKHAINMGKWAALKTAFNEIFVNHSNSKGCITLDSDGQHNVIDALKIAKILSTGEDFVLGCRTFTKDIPLKSYLGNTISKKIYAFILGRKIKDTQTGLRGLSREFMKDCLSIKSNRFEFETEQFVIAVRDKINIYETDIQTIYIENNSGSHFNPLFDSLRIYFILLRYVSVSFATFLIDFLVFSLSFGLGASVLWSNLLARTASIVFQYNASKKYVFKINVAKKYSFILFVAYVYLSGVVSVIIQEKITSSTGLNVLLVKILVESILFIISYSFVRTIVFNKKEVS